jgi:uncharacterized Zn finger protein
MTFESMMKCNGCGAEKMAGEVCLRRVGEGFLLKPCRACAECGAKDWAEEAPPAPPADSP